MKAEYIIGLEILCFLLGFFIRDLKDLGASSPKRRRVPSSRREAPRTNWKQPW